MQWSRRKILRYVKSQPSGFQRSLETIRQLIISRTLQETRYNLSPFRNWETKLKTAAFVQVCKGSLVSPRIKATVLGFSRLKLKWLWNGFISAYLAFLPFKRITYWHYLSPSFILSFPKFFLGVFQHFHKDAYSSFLTM